MKLIKKERLGSKIRKRYDQAKTPYLRVLLSPYVSEKNKERLREIYLELNPAELKRKITKVQSKLRKLTTLKEELRKKEDFEYIFDEATISHFV